MVLQAVEHLFSVGGNMRGFQFVSYLVLYCWSGIAKAGEPDYFAAYLSAEISKCELRNLQSYWKLPTGQETKIAIGKSGQTRLCLVISPMHENRPYKPIKQIVIFGAWTLVTMMPKLWHRFGVQILMMRS